MTKVEALCDTVVVAEGFFTVVKRSVRVDDTVIERQVVLHPGAVVIVPLMADGRVLFVRQFRSAVGEELLEFPAGKRDIPLEGRDVTASRELGEECGLSAQTFIDLGEFYNSPGFTNEETAVFVASGLTKVPRRPDSPEESAMDFVVLDPDQVELAIKKKELKDGKSLVAWMLLQRWRETHSVRGQDDSPEVREWLASLT